MDDGEICTTVWMSLVPVNCPAKMVKIRFDIWQNQYNVVKFKNKIKFKK